MTTRANRYVLTIDGGGIRGLIPAILLEDLETRTGTPARRLFDLIAGTSTGGILAAALGAGVPASRIARLYLRDGPQIFDRGIVRKLLTLWGMVGSKYRGGPLREALADVLEDRTLGSVDVPLLITAYSLTTGKPVTLKSHVPEDADISLLDAAMATAAAPTFFPPHRVGDHWLVDGGVWANHPGPFGFVEAVKLWPDDQIVVISLGTGRAEKSWDGEKAGGWGAAKWLRPIVSILMDGPTEAHDHTMRHLRGDRYIRVNKPVPGVDMDSTDRDSMRLLIRGACAAKSSLAWKRVAELFRKGGSHAA